MGSDHSRFAVLVLTHGRPSLARNTAKALRDDRYSGRILYVIDSDDSCGDEYRERFGAENVVVFDKAEVEGTFDVADSLPGRRGVVYARNTTFAIARDLGLDYFVQMDDDYFAFGHRYANGDRLGWTRIRSMDAVVEAMLTFLDDTDAAIVAFSQGGDHMGGPEKLARGVLRKAMNALFCRTDRPVEFLGRINEDVTTYVVHGSRGGLFLTVLALQLEQTLTQVSAGGLTEIYLDSGTYVKSFYTVMMAPSCVTVRTMGRTDRRMHHHVRWDHAVPKILNPAHRKSPHDGRLETVSP